MVYCDVVVIGESLAVAAHDIANGATGILYLEGEFIVTQRMAHTTNTTSTMPRRTQ